MTASTPQFPSKQIIRVGRLPLALSAVVTFSLLASVLWFSRYGIDFTDESFYLVWMANPFNYAFSATQFGFIYHPLYNAVGGSVAALRQANIIIIFGLAWCACDLFLKGVMPQSSEPLFVRPVLSAAIATSSLSVLVFAGLWFPTPSYNSLAFKGLLVITIGILLADKSASRKSTFGWVLIGLGGWLAFMGKPTTAAVAGFLVTVYVLIAGKFAWRILFSLLFFVTLLLVSALVIDGSVVAFVDRYKGGLDLASLLDSGYSAEGLLRIGDFQLQPLTKWVFWVVVLATVGGLAGSMVWRAESGLAVSAIQLTMMVFGLAGAYQFSLQAGTPDRFQNLLLGALVLATIPVVPLCQMKFLKKCSFSHWALALPFMGFGYAYAFGSGNNYWVPIGSAGLYFSLLSLVFVAQLSERKEFPRLVLTFAIAVQVISVGLVARGLESPYRQPIPLRKNDFSAELGRSGGFLVLARSAGTYIMSAREITSRSGFLRGTPMIDLSGHSPGLLHQLEANSIGLAWALGGYPGSAQFVAASLRMVPCEQLAEAWLVTEPKGPLPISAEVLETFGAKLHDHFEFVGGLISPDGQAQQIFKPNRSKEAATVACRDRRTKQL